MVNFLVRVLATNSIRSILVISSWSWLSAITAIVILGSFISPLALTVIGLIGSAPVGILLFRGIESFSLEYERFREEKKRGGKEVLGRPPHRERFDEMLQANARHGKSMVDRYLVGFEVDTGEPLWVTDNDICGHGCVFAKTGVGKTLWLESLIFQQMLRGRASGCTFIDAKRDSTTLANIVLMAAISGRLEDLIIIDPFDPVHTYNFTLTEQRADVKARKILRAGLPPTSDQSVTKHYDRLASDSIYRLVRALEATGTGWSIRDVAVALSSFHLAYPRLRKILEERGADKALIELGHLASSYRTTKGTLDAGKITENLRGIASELNSIANSQLGNVFCSASTDLVLTDAILRGKIIYFTLPRLEEAESAQRMIKLFREDLEISIGEITSSRYLNLEDPHLIVIDEGSSTFGPSWANLFELARKGRFALLFGAQSTGALTDHHLGLSEAFFERVMANVNLKVMMRVGDNRTAEEMAQWIGKSERSQGANTTRNHSKPERGFSNPNLRVSAEELKHSMSSEKGLAWFDLGDGRIVKGRSFWLDAEIPDGWDGRSLVPRYEKQHWESLGLADSVDQEILRLERYDGVPGGHKSGATNIAATSKELLEDSISSMVMPARDKLSDNDKQTSSETTLFRISHRGRGRGKASSFYKRSSEGKKLENEEENQVDNNESPGNED